MSLLYSQLILVSLADYEEHLPVSVHIDNSEPKSHILLFETFSCLKVWEYTKQNINLHLKSSWGNGYLHVPSV